LRLQSLPKFCLKLSPLLAILLVSMLTSIANASQQTEQGSILPVQVNKSAQVDVLDPKSGQQKHGTSSELMADAQRLVGLMQQTYLNGNFELIALQLGQGRLEPLRITHSVAALTDGSESEQVSAIEHHIYLNGPASEALKIDGRLFFFEQGLQPLVLSAEHLPGLLPKLVGVELETLCDSYRLVLAGRNRIAGRIAQVVRVIPKDPSLYPMQLWIDLATKLPLRMDLLNREEQLIAQLMVVSLLPLPNRPNWLEELSNIALPLPTFNANVDQAEKTQEQNEFKWSVAWLPKGLVPVYEDFHALPLIQSTAAYKKFSNGMVDISVYVSKLENNPQVQRQRVIQSSVSLYSMVVDEFEIIVVGEIPIETAQRIAESVTIRGK